VQNPSSISGGGKRYQNAGGEPEYAVVIGNFPSLEDKQFERTLDDVRKYQPETLKGKGSPTPFSMAFGLANPMLPPENHGVVDDFIARINKDRPYTLLQNRSHYTVKIATFTGDTVLTKTSALSSTLDKLNLGNSNKKTKLEAGEQAAEKLCETLRKQGVEAYVFHDRSSSIVTVGSFNQHSIRMPNGTLVPDPMIDQIFQNYQMRRTGNSVGLVTIDGIECDAMPEVVEVPRIRR